MESKLRAKVGFSSSEYKWWVEDKEKKRLIGI
jgi:hypothetical protein